ncbi:MAG TPA: GDP-L-fucose synthase [Kiritimatiellia bacterium]|nr:GDP-L-fucose synthase [Kiritimatiellia bacterium]
MMASPYKRILVTGATGFLGRHITPALQRELDAQIIPVGSRDYNLLHRDQVEAMLRDTKPDAVVHLAAKVGGIIANKKYPAEFFYENIVINTQTFHACYQAGVKKFLTVIGGCSYPALATSPIGMDQMWKGFPQRESAPYSVAKKMMLIQSEAYRKQYGFNSVVLIPGNVYGEWDNFNEEYSHVIPAMIRRYVEAREKGAKSMIGYGSGRPTRDFVYAGDVAALVPWFLLNYDSSEGVNISSGTRTPIRELAETIREVTGFQGPIEWDTSKPDGQMDKIFSVEKLHALGLSCPTPLREGLQRTADWFIRAQKEGTVRV